MIQPLIMIGECFRAVNASPAVNLIFAKMRASCGCNQAEGSNWPCGVMVARLTTNQEVVVSSTTSVNFFLSTAI